MEIRKSLDSGLTLLALQGQVALGESGRQLADALREELESGSGHVLLEMSGIDYVDSTGIGELVGYLIRFAKEQRRLVLVGASERILLLLRVAGIEGMFRSYSDLEDARAAEAG